MPVPGWEEAFYSLTRLDASQIDVGALTFAKWRQMKREQPNDASVALLGRSGQAPAV
jgi:hypothetical protein